MQNVSKALTIFNATDEAKPLNPNDFDFALAEDESVARQVMQKSGETAAPSEKKRASRRILGMTPIQIAVIAALESRYLHPRGVWVHPLRHVLSSPCPFFIHRHSSIQRRKPPARNIGAGFSIHRKTKFFFRGDRGGK
ncbi:MAG: hypothetical protein U0X87_01480 [Anaerolineales bacterium]